jgi:hypothetical protein
MYDGGGGLCGQDDGGLAGAESGGAISPASCVMSGTDRWDRDRTWTGPFIVSFRSYFLSTRSRACGERGRGGSRDAIS